MRVGGYRWDKGGESMTITKDDKMELEKLNKLIKENGFTDEEIEKITLVAYGILLTRKVS